MGEKKQVLYEDSEVIVKLHPKPCTVGHAIIIPKEHYPIIENVPDKLIAKIFSISNKISTALFDSINSQGTNIIINNGINADQTEPHFMAHVISRREHDNLNFQWAAKQFSDEEMGLAELQLKEANANIAIEKEKKTELIEEKKVERIEPSKGKENYIIKQLNRMP